MLEKKTSFVDQVEKKQTRTNNKYALVDSMVEYNRKKIGPAACSLWYIFLR